MQPRFTTDYVAKASNAKRTGDDNALRRSFFFFVRRRALQFLRAGTFAA
jgi:hypothetical protein